MEKYYIMDESDSPLKENEFTKTRYYYMELLQFVIDNNMELKRGSQLHTLAVNMGYDVKVGD